MPRIVIIDDEPVLRMTFRHFLEDDGYTVEDAGSGKAGVDLCRHERPDLVITDVTMPKQEGWETLSILREEFPGVPVIAISGPGIVFTTTNGKSGGYRYIQKPVDRPALLEIVHSLIHS